MRVRQVYGVDFSGARLAGRTTWIAEARPTRAGRLRVVALDRLERLAGDAAREVALPHLVGLIRGSRAALWGIDAPFGLPVEVLEAGARWTALLRLVRGWEARGRVGYDLGLWALARARALGGAGHLRRATDVESRAPFDPYHYRIIYQTYHVLRDVLAPLEAGRGTATVPFHYGRVPGAERLVAETCPGSTLKRLGLPHQNYKQAEGGALTARRRRTRGVIVAGLAAHVELDATIVRRVMRDPGGDALDAVIAAVGVWQGWRRADHLALARDRRVRREGWIYY